MGLQKIAFFISHRIHCVITTKTKTPNVKTRAALGSYHMGTSMERVYIDILGPLPTTEQNNKYIC